MSEIKVIEDVEVGKTYNLRHSRFGKATVIIKDIPDDTWIDVEIESGVLRGQGACAIWESGDLKRVRRSHCYFTEHK